jgi:hypothetical protein
MARELGEVGYEPLTDPGGIGGGVDITVKPFGVEPAPEADSGTGTVGRSLFSSYSPEEQTEVSKVADQLGVSPEAIAGVSRIETGEGFRNLHSPGSQYHGLFQMNVGEGYRHGMSRVEQIRAYGQMAKDKNYLGKLEAAGIDISAMSPSKQAAILQGFQFAPNAKAWLHNFDTDTTASHQSSELKYGKSINAMSRVFEELMGGTQPGRGKQVASVWDFGSGIYKQSLPSQQQAQTVSFRADASPAELQQDVAAARTSRLPWSSYEPMQNPDVPKPNAYPTQTEGEFAQKIGFAYGQPWERHFMDQVHHFALQPFFTEGLQVRPEEERVKLEIEGGKTVEAGRSPRADTMVRRTVARAAIASSRNPIAALGFDPKHITLDVLSQPTTLMGETIREYMGKPTPDIPVTVNVPGAQEIYHDSSPVLVHESIHRGLEKLRRRYPRAWNAFVDAAGPSYEKLKQTVRKESDGKERTASGEELLVRHIMRTQMGDPELPPAEYRGEQREQAMKWFADNPQLETALEKLQEFAADMIMNEGKSAARAIGGPRGPH